MYIDEYIKTTIYSFLDFSQIVKIENNSKKYYNDKYNLKWAVVNKKLNVISWLLNEKPHFCKEKRCIWKDCIKFSTIEILKLLLKYQTNIPCCHDACKFNLMDTAAEFGRYDIIQWCHLRNYNCSSYAMDAAAENGHLKIVQFLHHYRNEGCSHRALDYAAENGHLYIVHFLHFNRTEGCSKSAIDHAAVNNHYDIVRFLLNNRFEGFTHWAIENSNEQIKELLESY